MSERAWLVEWRFNGVQWLYLTGGSFNFTSDPNKALRFARREDAEAAMAWAREFDRRRGLRETGETTVTEHEWTSTTLSASPQAPAQPSAAAPSAQAEPNADLRADFERECADTDKLLTALGLSPEHCRTDGGSLKLGMILEALEARDRLIRREAAQAEPQEPLTDEQIAEFGALCVMNRRSKKTARELLAEYRLELGRGITKEQP